MLIYRFSKKLKKRKRSSFTNVYCRLESEKKKGFAQSMTFVVYLCRLANSATCADVYDVSLRASANPPQALAQAGVQKG